MLSTPFYLSCWDVQSIMPTLSHTVPVWDSVLSSKQPQERKQTFLPTFGWRFLTGIKAAQRLNSHFMFRGVHLVLTVNWKWAVLQLSHRLITNCFSGAICTPNVISTERYCYKLLRSLSAACSLASVYLQFTWTIIILVGEAFQLLGTVPSTSKGSSWDLTPKQPESCNNKKREK